MKQSELAFDKASWTEEAFDRKALADRALAMHGRNFNCAQCVACTLAPFVGADEDFVFRATEALGGGMGGFTETCGAISGGEVIIGLACSNGSDNPTSKQDTSTISAPASGRPFAKRSRTSKAKRLFEDATSAFSTASR